MISAFGVDHSLIAKAARSEQEKHYGRMAATTGAMGAGAGALGTAAGVIGHMEAKGHDPMGFAEPRRAGQTVSPYLRSRIIRPQLAGHRWQAKTLGGIGAASLGLAAGYKHRQHRLQRQQAQPVLTSKRDSRQRAEDIGMDTAAVGAAGGMGYAGHVAGSVLHEQAGVAHARAQDAKKVLAGERTPNSPFYGRGKKRAEFAARRYKMGRRVYMLKRPGSALAYGAAGAGALGMAEVGRHVYASHKEKQ